MSKEIIAKKDSKFIALLIVLVIIISEICLIPSNILADSRNLESQNNATNNKYVNFDTYFIKDGKNIHEIEITDENISEINFELNIKNGYLKNATIALNDPNFSLKNNNSKVIENIENNVLRLKEINNNQKISIPIVMDKKDVINLNYLNKETKVVFSGTFVSDNGKEQKVEKEILVRLKWNLNTEINLTSNITNFIPNDNKTLLQEKINIKEVERKNPIQETKLYVSVPKIHDTLPEDIRVVANSTQATNGDVYGTKFSKDNYKYDKATGNLEINVEIIISEICLIPSNILADSRNLESQNNATNNKYVNFDTYFIKDGKNIHEIEITDENISEINFELNIKNGYLKNATIALNDPNFSLKNNNSKVIENIENNVLRLKEINNNQKISIPIVMDKKDVINLNYLNKETKVVFSGTFVSDNGKEQKVEKEILVRLKWNLNTEINLTSNITNFIPNDNKTLLQEKINIKEVERKNPIQETKLYVSVPKIHDTLPEDIRVVANSTQATNGDVYGTKFSKDNYKYDKATGNLEINVDNKADENGNIAFYDAVDEYVITYIYM